jgi:hypothetical protein
MNSNSSVLAFRLHSLDTTGYWWIGIEVFHSDDDEKHMVPHTNKNLREIEKRASKWKK